MGIDRLNHRFACLRARVEEICTSDGTASGAGSRWVRDALQWLDSAQSELREAEGRLDVAHLISEVGAWRFRAFFDQVPMGFLITDLDGVVLELNREAADILGEPRHQLLGDLIHHRLADRGRCLDGFSTGLDASDLAGEFHVEIRGVGSRIDAKADVIRRPDRAGDSAELFWLLRRTEVGEPANQAPAVPLHDIRSSLSTILNTALLLSMTTSGDDARTRQLYEMIARQVGAIARWIDAPPQRSGADAFAREN